MSEECRKDKGNGGNKTNLHRTFFTRRQHLAAVEVNVVPMPPVPLGIVESTWRSLFETSVDNRRRRRFYFDLPFVSFLVLCVPGSSLHSSNPLSLVSDLTAVELYGGNTARCKNGTRMSHCRCLRGLNSRQARN